MKRFAVILLVVIVALIVMAFTVLNTAIVPVDVYFYSIDVPVSVLIFVSLLLGAVLGVLVSVGLSWQQRSEIRKLRKQLALSEQEVFNLRKIPIKDSH